MNSTSGPYVNPKDFHIVAKKLRAFFDSKGLIESPTQSRLSILAACEDPTTIATFDYGKVWPLPQTGQMWLEYDLLTNPEQPGFFTFTTSYRHEKNPVAGRHETIFPLAEFELRGTYDDLLKFVTEMLQFLGFKPDENGQYPGDDYLNVAAKYGVKELGHDHEEAVCKDYGNTCFFLKNFPNYTSPFWNMKQSGDGITAKKLDVIIAGQETVGSAERSSNPVEMRHMFDTISEGGYAQILYNKFGKERVEAELDGFLKLDFFPRFGGGIGMTRLIRAMKINGLI